MRLNELERFNLILAKVNNFSHENMMDEDVTYPYSGNFFSLQTPYQGRHLVINRPKRQAGRALDIFNASIVTPNACLKPNRVPVLAMIAPCIIANVCVIIQTPDKLRPTERKINGFG